jgi:hypothetical protein
MSIQFLPNFTLYPKVIFLNYTNNFNIFLPIVKKKLILINFSSIWESTVCYISHDDLAWNDTMVRALWMTLTRSGTHNEPSNSPNVHLNWKLFPLCQSQYQYQCEMMDCTLFHLIKNFHSNVTLPAVHTVHCLRHLSITVTDSSMCSEV